MDFINKLAESEQGKSVLAAAEKQFNQTEGVEGAEEKSLFDRAKEFAESDQGKKTISEFEQKFSGEGGSSDLLAQAQSFLGGSTTKTQE